MGFTALSTADRASMIDSAGATAVTCAGTPAGDDGLFAAATFLGYSTRLHSTARSLQALDPAADASPSASSLTANPFVAVTALAIVRFGARGPIGAARWHLGI